MDKALTRRVAIVGCGLIGGKRALSLPASAVASVTDTVPERAENLAIRVPGARVIGDWRRAVEQPDVEAVVVATTHDMLAPIAEAAALAGKHVLVEKPGACRPQELDAVERAAARTGVTVRVGFNHRFHPALIKARQWVASGELGPLMFLRARYGHGGRLGYEKEWRAKPELSGGGEAIDQGIHLVDLSRWLMGPLRLMSGFSPTYFWDMPVEDNAFMLLKTDAGQAAWLHASWTEWKNLFCLEIYGRIGKLQVDGLGGSYGTERLTWYRMKPELGPPDVQEWTFPEPDTSWSREMEDFFSAIGGGPSMGATLPDARAALQIVQEARAFR